MLSTNPELAKKIILNEKPTISEDSSNIEPHLLDKLVDNIGLLSSVYYKPPEQFVKKIRDRINERLDLENDDARPNDEYEDSTGVKRSEYVGQNQNVESYHNFIGGTTDLLGVGDD